MIGKTLKHLFRSSSLPDPVKHNPTFPIFSSFPHPPPPATAHSHLNRCVPGTRFFTTSLPDGLKGLIDPADPNLRPGAVSGAQFEFLHDSLLRPKHNAALNVNPGTCSNEAVAIATVIRDTNDGFGDKTQKFLRQHREKLCESFVVEVLGSLRDTELGVKFFIWAGRQIGYVHTAAVYNALLEIMDCGEKNVRVADSVLREIKDDDRQVLGILLNLLVRKCCRGGMWNLALEELGRLKDYGYRPTQATYNALVQVFLQADKFDTAKLVHREMSGAGFHMDAHNLGCFVYSLCKSGNWRDALELIGQEQYATLSMTVIYTKMICGLCEASLFDEAFNLLDRMRSSSWIPNVETYSVFLCGCLRKRQLGRCKRILSMMIAEGCYPSRETFNLLVSAFCTSGDHSYAKKLFKKMVKCGYRPGYVVYNILIGSICSNEEALSSDLLELAEEVYSEMLCAGVVLNKVNVCSFARCLCGAGKFDEAHKIIREMMEKGFKPDSSTYTEVISFLGDSSKVEKAFSLFEEMKNNDIIPDVYTYTVMIDSFCKVGLIDQAESLFNEMARLGCPPNVVTYTALIHACLKASKISRANELFEMMQSEGIAPNIVTYTALIDGHCKAGKTETACQIYSRMRGNIDFPSIDLYFKLSDNDANKPNVFTYGALVDGLCKSHKVEEAHHLLDAMEVAGCEPNHIVYDALIDGFCKVGQLDEALKVFNKMSRHGTGPSTHTYSSFIDRSFKEGRPDQALKFVSRMLENSCAPNVVIYTSMIDGLCKDGKIDLAYRLMLVMEDEGCRPNVITYTAMIDGFGKVGEVKKGLELLKQMSSKGCSPNFVTYAVLIKHCCAAGLLDEAYRLLNEMKLTYWPKHPTGYRKVIEGFSRQFIVSLGLVDEMAEMESVPFVPFYSVVMDNFVKAGRLELALDLHEEIISSSAVSPDYRNTYASLIESLSLASKVDKACELYAESTRRGIIPELTSFVHLVRGLVRINKWEEALMLSHGLCQMEIHWHKEEKLEGS